MLVQQVWEWGSVDTGAHCFQHWKEEGSSQPHSTLLVYSLASLSIAMTQAKNYSYTGNSSLHFLCQPCLPECGGVLWPGVSSLCRTCGKQTLVSFLSSNHHQEAETAQVAMSTRVDPVSWLLFEPSSIPRSHFLESDTAFGIWSSLHGFGESPEIPQIFHVFQSCFPVFLP